MNQLNNIVSTTGLLLTLMTFLFNLFWDRIKNSLDQDEAISGPKERERIRKKVQNTFFSIALPLFISFFALFYINLPTSVQIIQSSQIDFWNFNVDKTIFIMIELALFSFVLFNAFVIYKLIKKIGKLK